MTVKEKPRRIRPWLSFDEDIVDEIRRMAREHRIRGVESNEDAANRVLRELLFPNHLPQISMNKAQGHE
ncbi:hypothetical protein CCP3SC15_1420002 [Gammaproteobacteria bacterium]